MTTTIDAITFNPNDRVTPDAGDGWRPPKGWPGNARAVTQRLHRQAPVMRKAGWVIEDDDAVNHDKVIRWTIRWTIRPARTEMVGNPDPRHPRDPRQASDQGIHTGNGAGQIARNAGVAGHRDPHLTRAQSTDPQETTSERAGHSTVAGHAGVAGVESGPSPYADGGHPASKDGHRLAVCDVCRQAMAALDRS